MPGTYSGGSVSKALPLVSFFTISDIHITDKESPAQAIYLGLKDGIKSAYSPVMPYTTDAYNAELVKPISTEMQVKIKSFATLIRQN